MTKLLRFVRACLLSVVFLPSFTYADSIETYLRLGAGVQDFGYKEFNDQNVLIDREDGPIPGLVMEVGNKWQDVAGIFRFELFDGLVDYDGQTNSGIPLTTRSDERVTTIEVLFRYDVRSFAKYHLNLSVGVGDRKWRRNILATNTTTSLLEIYQWKYFTLGSEAIFWQRGKWSAGIGVNLLRPIRPTMLLVSSSFDEATLRLGTHNSVRMKLPLQFVDGAGREWAFTPYWESWRLGRSADVRLTSGGVPTSIIAHEPRSETNIVGVTVSVRL